MKAGIRQKRFTTAFNKYKSLLAHFSLAGLLTCTVISLPAVADEAGVSVWLPGQFGSLAAKTGESGWSLPLIYYHTSTEASGGKNFAVAGIIRAGLDVRTDLMLIAPTYTFASPVWGGQAQVSLTTVAGKQTSWRRQRLPRRAGPSSPGMTTTR